MSDIIHLNAEPRDLNGKGSVRALRNAGKIPAVIYGDKKASLPVSLERKDITKVYNSGRIMATLLEVEVEGKASRVIARDIQLDPVKDIILHADFLRVGQGTKIAVEVQVNFLNEETCPGLKQGGVLNVVRYKVELLCPAESIPEFIELDLTEAEIGTSLHISDIQLPEGIIPTITDRDFTVATIAAPAGLTDDIEDEEDIEGEDGIEGIEGTQEDTEENSEE